ncbi:FAD-binding oxidoreductase [Sphingomonas sp. MA1305]|uniref:NAD(P)/FAD-dependent oxidoreductase n=1 Tax=Sphingomonas sp. MA1305 TaxID=2479204 RepID=UPI0018DF0D8D|nr:FAD-binding oxidoreductase [Sphingomonas sp. MA1305]
MKIAILGGGIVGRSIALALAGRGARVVLVDDGDMAAASWGNAGHIAIEQGAPLASLATIASVPRRLFLRGGAVALPPRMAGAWLPFSLRLALAARPARFAAGTHALGTLLRAAAPAWQRLAAAIDAPTLLALDGHVVAWESGATATAGRAAWAAAPIGTASLRDLAAGELATLRGLAPAVAGAVRFDGTGRIADLGRLAAALDAALARAGVERVTQRARLIRDGRRVAIEGVAADRIVVAAGIGSRALLASIGWRVPLIAERGYHARFAPGDWPAGQVPVVFEDRSLIVTRYADTVQAAGFVEFGRAEAPADPRKWRRLEAHVAALGLPVGPVASRWMGVRPTLPDYLPAIGRATQVDDLFYAFGHQHLGLTLGPLTGELVADLVTGATPAADLAPFALERLTGRLP